MSTDTTPPTTVQEGYYLGCTQSELDDELTRYKQAIAAHSKMRIAGAGGTLQFASVVGKQITFNMADADAHFRIWRQRIANANDQLSGVCQRYTDRSVARFS